MIQMKSSKSDKWFTAILIKSKNYSGLNGTKFL